MMDKIGNNEWSLPKVTRVELINHGNNNDDIVKSFWNLNEVFLSIQDEGRTLKVFVK